MHRRPQVIDINDRFREIMREIRIRGLLAALFTIQGRLCDDLCVRGSLILPDQVDGVEPAHIRQFNIHLDQIGAYFANVHDGASTGTGFQNRMSSIEDMMLNVITNAFGFFGGQNNGHGLVLVIGTFLFVKLAINKYTNKTLCDRCLLL